MGRDSRGRVVLAAVALTSESGAFRSPDEERGAVASLRDDTRETIELEWWFVRPGDAWIDHLYVIR